MNSQVNVFTGEKGRSYYQVSTGDVFYDISFPLNIALECSAPNSIMGPQHCNNCRSYGSYNDITLLLCFNCAEICIAHKHDRCACDNLQVEIDEQLQHFKSDGDDDGFMCMGCGFGAKCNLHLWYSDVDFDGISLSHEHHELVSYKEFMRRNNYDINLVNEDLVQVNDEDESYAEPDTDTESSASSIDCLSSTSAEDMSSLFSIEDDLVDLTKEVCDLTFQYDEEMLKLYPLIKQNPQVAIESNEVEKTRFEEYDFLHWHFKRLNNEY